MPNRQQTIIWTNDSRFYPKYSSLGPGDLNIYFRPCNILLVFHRYRNPGYLLYSTSTFGRFRHCFMMTSNRHIFRVTGPLCGQFTGHRRIPLTMASDTKLWCFALICTWINGWVNNFEAGDLRRHHAHYDVIVMHLRYRGFNKMANIFQITLSQRAHDVIITSFWLDNVNVIIAPCAHWVQIKFHDQKKIEFWFFF